MKVWSRSAHAQAILFSMVFLGAGVASFRSVSPAVAILFVGLAWLWYHQSMKRYYHRRRVAREPFPEEWRGVLEKQVRYYRELPPGRRSEFERDVAMFIGEHRFSSVEGVGIAAELKVLAAASAVMLIFNRPDLEYPRISEVVLYPGAFGEDYATHGPDRNTLGQNHPDGAVILSVPDLRRGFASSGDGQHLGIHEFAHALDREGEGWDGIPMGVPPARRPAWRKVITEETERILHGRGVLEAYAATDHAEFFPVAAEMYFERSEDIRRDCPELHALLLEYFGPVPSPPPPSSRNKRQPDLRP